MVGCQVNRSDQLICRFAVIRCEHATAAQDLIDELNGAAIDVNHRFNVELAERFERFAGLQQNGLVDQNEVDGLRVLRRSQ